MSNQKLASGKANHGETKLLVALKIRKKTTTVVQIAKGAQVSTKTVNLFLKGQFKTSLNSDSRRLRGYVITLCRLASYLILDPAETLTEYGIDPKLVDSVWLTKQNEDIFPLMKAVVTSGHEGIVTFQDFQFLQCLQHQLCSPLTPSAIKVLLTLRHPLSSA